MRRFLIIGGYREIDYEKDCDEVLYCTEPCSLSAVTAYAREVSEEYIADNYINEYGDVTLEDFSEVVALDIAYEIYEISETDEERLFEVGLAQFMKEFKEEN